MNSKKVIHLYISWKIITNSNTGYINELKKSNTFWLLVITEFNFSRGFKILWENF